MPRTSPDDVAPQAAALASALLVLKGLAWGAVGGAVFGAALALAGSARWWVVRAGGTVRDPWLGRPETSDLVAELLSGLSFFVVAGTVAGLVLGCLVGLVAAGVLASLRPVLPPEVLVVATSALALAVVPVVLGVVLQSAGDVFSAVVAPIVLIAAPPLVLSVHAAVVAVSGGPADVRWWGRPLPWRLMTGAGLLVGGGCGTIYGAFLGAVVGGQEPPYEALVVPDEDEQDPVWWAVLLGAVLGGLCGAVLGAGVVVLVLLVVTVLRPAVPRRLVGPIAVALGLGLVAAAQTTIWGGHLHAGWIWAPVGITAVPLTLCVAGLLHRGTVRW